MISFMYSIIWRFFFPMLELLDANIAMSGRQYISTGLK